MENIFFEGNRQKPKILFDAKKGVLEIKGRSLPEQAHDLYKPLLDWIDQYQESPQSKTILNVYLEYINSSSNKYLLLILKKLDTLFLTEHDVLIHWYYDFDDEDMLETIEECKSMLSLPIVLHSVNPDTKEDED